MQDVTKGKVLGERYELTTKLESSASFTRWIARDEKLNRDVLITVFSSDSPYVEQALDSARRAASLEDPRIVRVLDAGQDDDFAYVVEEAHLGAHHLADLVRFELPHPEEARRIVGEAATALEAARHRGLHHLSLKPTHVLRLSDGSIALTHTAVEASIEGKDDVSSADASRADAKALVELLYLALTGLWPGKSLDIKGMKDAPRRADKQLRAPSQLVEGVPNDLDTLTRQTLNHGEVPASPGAVARQLSPWSAQLITAPGRARGESDDTDPNLGAKVDDDKGFTVRRGGSAAKVAGVGAVGAAALAAADKSASTPGSNEAEPSKSAQQAAKSGSTTRAALPGQPSRRPAAQSSSDAAPVATSAAAANARSTDPDETGSYTPYDEDSAYERTSYDPSFEELEPPVPGFSGGTDDPDRSASRLALALVGIFVIAALVLAVFGIKGLGQSHTSQPAPAASSSSSSSATKPSPSSSSSSTSSAPSMTPVGIAGASIVNKYGYRVADTNANQAVDGDSSTGWTSLHYLNQSWGGYQSYGGMAVKLDESVAIKQIKITPDPQLPLTADIYVSDTPGTSGQKVGSVSNATTPQTVDAKGAKGIYVTIFITNQPKAPGQSYYQSGIKEVSVEK